MGVKRAAIAGAGVAGLGCAALLAARGWRVTLFDKMPAPAPIGSGLILQPVGLHVLDAIGAGERIRELGAPIVRLYGKTVPSQRVVLDVRYDALGPRAPTGVAVHRGALFQVLHEAALAAGAEIEAGREIAACDVEQLSAQFDLVIDALGMRSPLSKLLQQNLPFGALWASLNFVGGFDAAALEQRYEAARKMVGVLPIGRLRGGANKQGAFFWSLKHADYATWRAAPLDAWKDDVRALWPETEPLLAQISAHEDLVFAAYAHRTMRTPVTRRVAHVGDSWHCTSPQLGQGANMALLDALALAIALERQSDLDLALAEYARLRLWHIRLYQAASWMFTPAYQSDSAALAFVRDQIMAPLSQLWPAPPLLAALVAGQLGAPLAAMGVRVALGEDAA